MKLQQRRISTYFKQELVAKIEANSEKISRLIDQVVENHTAIDRMVTREEYRKDYARLPQGQDKMMAILLRLDQERAVTKLAFIHCEQMWKD